MTRYLCRECHTDLTPKFITDFEEMMKTIHPQLIQMKETLVAQGAENIKIDVNNIGGDVHCPKCGIMNEIRLDTLDQLEELVMEMNR